LVEYSGPLPNDQPRRRATPGEVSKHRARLVETRPREQHARDAIVARPQLDLAEVVTINKDRNNEWVAIAPEVQ
jgi:hypothetical protein